MEAISVHFLVKVLIVFSIIYLISLRRLAGKVIDRYTLYKYDQLELERYKHETTINITDSINEKLDMMIEQCFQEYTILNLAFKTDYYVTEKEEEKINREISALVAERISPAFYNQLSLYYNEDAITDVIAKRVYFRVTNFVIEHNNGTGIGA